MPYDMDCGRGVRHQARCELQVTRLLIHWSETKAKMLESSGYEVVHVDDEETDA